MRAAEAARVGCFTLPARQGEHVGQLLCRGQLGTLLGTNRAGGPPSNAQWTLPKELWQRWQWVQRRGKP